MVILEYGKLAPPFTRTPSFAQKAFRWDMRIGFTGTLVPDSFCEGRTKNPTILFSYFEHYLFFKGYHILTRNSNISLKFLFLLENNFLKKFLHKQNIDGILIHN